ncbi:MAG: hypothetical protein KJ072_20245 [Verrucomicrobia bacterium]|nr:hypothetical protein [Verrucomicrobiota bacterium]
MKTCAIGQVVKPADISRNATCIGLLFIIGLLLSACRPEVEVAKDSPASGVYTLVTVNGSNVPNVVSHEGAKLQVLSGTFTINPDGTCSSKMVFVPPSGAETTREVSATYTRDGRKLNMEWKGAGKTTGTIEGDTFTMNNEGMDFAYRKQP